MLEKNRTEIRIHRLIFLKIGLTGFKIYFEGFLIVYDSVLFLLVAGLELFEQILGDRRAAAAGKCSHMWKLKEKLGLDFNVVFIVEKYIVRKSLCIATKTNSPHFGPTSDLINSYWKIFDLLI